MAGSNGKVPDQNKVPTRDSGRVPLRENYDERRGQFPDVEKNVRIMPRDQLTPPPPMPRKKGG